MRSLLLPEARRDDTGIVGIAGKLALTDQVRAFTPAVILRGPTPILGPRGCFMFCSAVQYGDLASHDVALDIDSETPTGDCEEYVMWGFSARREKFSLPAHDEALGGEELNLRSRD